MDSLAKNGSTVFVDALMTCCPDEKELLLSWKGVLVLIFCSKVKHRNTLQLDIPSLCSYACCLLFYIISSILGVTVTHDLVWLSLYVSLSLSCSM